jgi:hypothetical protein
MKTLLLMAAMLAMVLTSAAPVFAQASTPPLPSCDPEALHENIQNLPQGTYCCPDGSWQLDPVPEPTFPGEEPEPPCEDAYPGHFVGDGHGSEAGADDAQYPEPNAEPNADEPEPIASPSAGEQGDNVQYNAVCQNIIGAGVDELVEFLVEWGDGVWPPAQGSGLREVQEFLDCGLGTALDVLEAAERRKAA